MGSSSSSSSSSVQCAVPTDLPRAYTVLLAGGGANGWYRQVGRRAWAGLDPHYSLTAIVNRSNLKL